MPCRRRPWRRRPWRRCRPRHLPGLLLHSPAGRRRRLRRSGRRLRQRAAAAAVVVIQPIQQVPQPLGDALQQVRYAVRQGALQLAALPQQRRQRRRGGGDGAQAGGAAGGGVGGNAPQQLQLRVQRLQHVLRRRPDLRRSGVRCSNMALAGKEYEAMQSVIAGRKGRRSKRHTHLLHCWPPRALEGRRQG